MYQLKWDEKALEDLKKIGAGEAKRIVKKVSVYLVKDPAGIGKPLRGSFKGLYRYRIGDYRVVYEIQNQAVQIVVVKVGHRKDIYD